MPIDDDEMGNEPPEGWEHTNAPFPRAVRPRASTPVLPGRPAGAVSNVRVFRQLPDGSGEASLGDLHPNEATEENIIDRFREVMPKPGERPVTFRIVPLLFDKTEQTNAQRYWTVDEHHVHLTRQRASAVPTGTNAETSALLATIAALTTQLDRISGQNEKLQQDNQKIAQEGVLARERNIAVIHTDVSEGYRGVLDAHREAIKTVQTDVAGGYDRVLTMQQRAQETEHARILADANAKVATAKAEAEASLEKMKLEATLERDRLASRERVELARLDAERDRIKADAKEREERDQKRQEREDEARDRREARDREDAMRREEIVTQNFTLTREFFQQSQEQTHAHMETQLQLVKAKSEGDNPLGGATKLLALFGMTPADGLALVKGLMAGGGGGWAEKLIETVGGVGKELLKTARATARIEAGMDDADGDDDGDEDEDEAPAAIEKKPDTPLPERGATAPIVPPAPTAAPAATPAATTAPVRPKSKLTKPILRKVRDAVATLIEALNAEPEQGKWMSILTPAFLGTPELTDWLREQSSEGALLDAQADPAFITRLLDVIDATGMVPGDIPRRLPK